MATKATALIERARTAPEKDCPAIFRALFALGQEARDVEVDALALVTYTTEPLRAFGARALLAVLGNEDTEVHLRFLVERVASGKGNERSAARGYLRELDATLVAPALLRALSHQRAAVRATAASLAASTVPLRDAFPVDALIDALGDADVKVRVAAIMAVVQHIAPAPPGKPSATLTPARRARLQPLVNDNVQAVADVAKRLFARLEP